MSSSRRRYSRNNFDKANIDKKMSQFIDVGRQFVDGVSGTRPGKRKNSNFTDFSRRNVKNVGKWVSDKMDSFFEDEYEEDWENENQYEPQSDYKSNYKRPLEAISLRRSENKIISQPNRLLSSEDLLNEEWPEDSDFRVNKWQRSTNNADNNIGEIDQDIKTNNRKIPRSRRRRI